MKSFFQSTITTIIILFLSIPTYAQEQATNSSSISSNSSTTLEQLQSDYFFQLEKYRKAEEVYNLDKAEYYKLDTLASKEKAVSSLKNLIVFRPLIYEIYLSALSTLVQPAQGIDIVQKQQALDIIETTKQQLFQHRQTIPTLSERENVLAESATFEQNLIYPINISIYKTLSLLSIGRVQRAYDQLILHTNEFKNIYVEPIPDANKKAFILRGLKDVDQQNSLAKAAIDKALLSYQQINDPKLSKNSLGIYTGVVKDLQPTYSAMKKSIRFLKELETQI